MTSYGMSLRGPDTPLSTFLILFIHLPLNSLFVIPECALLLQVFAPLDMLFL